MQGLFLSGKGEETKKASIHKNYLRACDSKKIVTAHSMPAKFYCVQRLQFQKQLTPIVWNIFLFESNQ